MTSWGNGVGEQGRRNPGSEGAAGEKEAECSPRIKAGYNFLQKLVRDGEEERHNF